ncbi:MAG: hypothetical protein Q9187_003719 [Circinaria calcarea]
MNAKTNQDGQTVILHIVLMNDIRPTILGVDRLIDLPLVRLLDHTDRTTRGVGLPDPETVSVHLLATLITALDHTIVTTLGAMIVVALVLVLALETEDRMPTDHTTTEESRETWRMPVGGSNSSKGVLRGRQRDRSLLRTVPAQLPQHATPTTVGSSSVVPHGQQSSAQSEEQKRLDEEVLRGVQESHEALRRWNARVADAEKKAQEYRFARIEQELDRLESRRPAMTHQSSQQVPLSYAPLGFQQQQQPTPLQLGYGGAQSSSPRPSAQASLPMSQLFPATQPSPRKNDDRDRQPSEEVDCNLLKLLSKLVFTFSKTTGRELVVQQSEISRHNSGECENEAKKSMFDIEENNQLPSVEKEAVSKDSKLPAPRLELVLKGMAVEAAPSQTGPFDVSKRNQTTVEGALKI